MSPDDDRTYYSQLETGARFLAADASSAAERDQHLGMAHKYALLRADAAAEGRR